jgi:hypothetical protein
MSKTPINELARPLIWIGLGLSALAGLLFARTAWLASRHGESMAPFVPKR